MFYGNPQLLERSLHNDLNTLIKNVKGREDQHLTLVQYNRGLVQQLSDIESIPFFQQQLAKHRSFLESVLNTHNKNKEQQSEILEKYQCTLSGQTNIVKLMGRVTARVMQILQASLQKIKHIDEKFQIEYDNIRNKMLDHIQDKQKVDVESLLDAIINHIQIKSQEEINRLQKIIDILVKGDFSVLSTVYVPMKKVQTQPQIKLVPPPQKKQIKKSLEKSKERIQKIRQQAKKVQNVKKKKAKLASKMLSGLYSTMQLSKQQFMEDMVFTNKQQKRKQLYEQMMSKNKFNHSQILQFQSQRNQFQEKVKHFKEHMQVQSQKIQQALVFVKPRVPEKQKLEQLRLQVKSQKAQTQEDEFKNLVPQKEKSFRKRQKTIKAPSPRLAKEAKTYISMQTTQDNFQHIKFDVKNQEVFSRSNRARLPQISGRSSLDNRYQGKSQNKANRRVNIVKNVDIGVINHLRPLDSDLGRKSPKQKVTPTHMFQNAGFQYTFYIRKKTNKFYETRNNFVF